VGSAGRSSAQSYNVVIHEFAHVLDMADGVADGVPLLPPDLLRSEWLSVLRADFSALQSRVEAGEDTALDPYGIQGEEEFFAVASEGFFVNPLAMQAEHPRLYRLFTRFYRQDPARDTPAPRRAP
jgi:Mlc titration factor MtfA (ptsG expression regulator)